MHEGRSGLTNLLFRRTLTLLLQLYSVWTLQILRIRLFFIASVDSLYALKSREFPGNFPGISTLFPQFCLSLN